MYKTPILLRGYHPTQNPERDYQAAKAPIQAGFTKPDYKPPGADEIKRWEIAGGWVGHLVPPGRHIIDVENPCRIAHIKSICHRHGIHPPINRTNNGIQLVFSLNGQPLGGQSDIITRCGVKLTYRAAGKNYVILPPTNGRTWENEDELDNPPQMPDALYPAQNTIEDTLRALAWAMGEAYRKGSLAGYDDLDAGFMSLLVSCETPEAQILEIFQLVFLQDFDERRTLAMHQRTRARKEKGEALHGAGSLVKALQDKGLDEIAGHVLKLQRLANVFEDDETSDILKILREGEVGIAKLLKTAWENKMRYDGHEGRWYLWGKHYWNRVSDERAFEAFEQLRCLLEGKAIVFAEKKISALGRDKQKFSHFEACEKSLITALKIIGDVSRRSEILKMCRSEGSFLGFTGTWDEHPFLIVCPNGVLNLNTLDFSDGNPGDNVRTSIPIEWNPDAKCPAWEDALSGIFAGNKDIIDYFQRVLGYCISGLNIHHYLWIWEGKGRNGKGLIYRILHHILDGFITFIDRELLLERKHGRQSGAPAPDVLALYGKRMAFMIETVENRKFDPGKMKWLTGGDIVTARGMYAKDITQFKSTAKLHLQTNFRPHISGGDYAAWQRIILLPFPMSFVSEPSADEARNERKANPLLEDAIKAESSGVLAWLVRGYRKYKFEGINPPACIKEATREYHKEEDSVGRFVEEKLETYMGSLLPAGECYLAYKQWCVDQDMQAKFSTTFGREIRLHLEVVKKSNKALYVGVKLR
jgi:putative DNA primase/helicase